MALVVLSAKVDPEVKAQFDLAFEESEAATKNQFFELLLEAFLNPKTKQVQVPTPTHEQTEALQLKDNEIGRLKTGHSFEVENLQGKITELETRPPEKEIKIEKIEPGENQLLIDVNPFAMFAIDDEIAAEKKKNKKEYSRGELLVNSFLFMKKNGRVDACRLWSDREFNQYKKEHFAKLNE